MHVAKYDFKQMYIFHNLCIVLQVYTFKENYQTHILFIAFSVLFKLKGKMSKLHFAHTYSKTCVKRPLKNRQNKDLNNKW